MLEPGQSRNTAAIIVSNCVCFFCGGDILIDKLINESYKALKHKDIPVSAFVVKNGKIISKAHNSRINKHLTINHAEIQAIIKANKKLKNWRLFDCDLYVTLEPCDMCMNVIKEARIKNVYYLVPRNENKKQYSKTYKCLINKNDEKIEKYKEKLTQFFKDNCNR